MHLRNGGVADTSSDASLGGVHGGGHTPAAIFGARFLPPTLKLEVHCAARCAVLLRCPVYVFCAEIGGARRGPRSRPLCERRSTALRVAAERRSSVVGGARRHGDTL